MNFIANVILFLQLFFINNGFAQRPTFRILAPQFICPSKTEPNATSALPVSTPGATTIRLQTASGQQFTYNWTVRFRVLNGPRGQRFNLLVWRVVRNLEKTLTEMGPEIAENNIVAINNTMLMEGVDYIFNISGVNQNGLMGDTKSFAIKFTDAKSEPKFDFVEADTDTMFSVVMLGSDTTYADVTYYLEAEITPCKPTNDYYFEWKVFDIKDNIDADIGQQKGKKLIIRPNTLIGGYKYDISCKIFKISDNKQITTNGLFLSVLTKGISVEMNIEKITMATSMPISIISKLINPDNVQGVLSYEWECRLMVDSDGKQCDDFKSVNESELNFERGLDIEGIYEIKITIAKGPEIASKKAIVIIQNAMLPIIDIVTVPVYGLSGRSVEIQARVFELRASCNMYWTSIKEDGYEFIEEKLVPGGFGTIAVNSYEETFLSEIVEFGNETIHRNFPLVIPSKSSDWPGLKPDAKYKFRLIVQCSCSMSLECEGPKNVTAFSDVTVKTNEAPIPKSIKVTPISGLALKDVFRFSTNSAIDILKDYPLTYTFGFKNSNGESIIISTYVENLGVETILPYSETGLIPTLNVCDSRMGCTLIEGDLITTLKPNAVTQEEIDFYLNKFEMQLYRKEYYDAFYELSIILQTFEVLNDQELEKSFTIGFENITKIDIIKQRKDVSEKNNVLKSNEFVEICYKFIEKFKVSDSLLQDLLKLRDETFEVLSQNSNESIRSVRSISNKFRKARSISPNDLKNYIDMSEYILSTSTNSEQILKEKKNILDKLELSTVDLCKLKQNIMLDWQTVSTSVEIISLKSNLGFFSIPYAYRSDRKINPNNIAEIKIVLQNNIPKQHCLQRSSFSMNLLNDFDSKRKGWIYYSVLYDSDLNNVDNFEVILKLPVTNMNLRENDIVECRRWNNDKWDDATCETNVKNVIQNKIEYVLCKCDTFGYYSLYVTEKPNISETNNNPVEFSTEFSSEASDIIDNDDDLIIINCKEDGTCEIPSKNTTKEKIGEEKIKLDVKKGDSSMMTLLFICITVAIFIAIIFIFIWKIKKRNYSVDNIEKLKVPQYNKFHDEYLMEGSLETLKNEDKK